MKRIAAVALLAVFAVGCGAKQGGGRGPTIQRTVGDSGTHGDLDRPIGQR